MRSSAANGEMYYQPKPLLKKDGLKKNPETTSPNRDSASKILTTNKTNTTCAFLKNHVCQNSSCLHVKTIKLDRFLA